MSGIVLAMLAIRLQRVGRKNDPAFRLIVTESTRGPKSGKYVELLGSYHPKTKATNLKPERIKHWMSVGAQVSGTAHNLLIKNDVIQGKKINVLPKKTPIKKDVVEEPAPAAAPVAEAVTEEVAEAPVVAEEAPTEAPAPEAEAPAADVVEDVPVTEEPAA
jgi:small subunit ribosomal protein S16